MSEKMNVLVAYDGSECADAALDDLQRAGLPAEVSAAVVSVAEQWLPTPRSFGMVETHFTEESPNVYEKAEAQAVGAAGRLRAAFPGWEIQAETLFGAPARNILEKADVWKPELIVVGSHGRSSLGRLFLGSVSQKILTEARCSVRVARGRDGDPKRPVRIVIGVDGSHGADLAVREVARRSWPAGSEVKVFTTDFIAPTMSSAHMVGPLLQWINEERERMRQAVDRARTTLINAGLAFYSEMKPGDPKELLCRMAEDWTADCIFVGAKSQSRVDRFLLGSVSASVAAHAPCSVEVVRENDAHQE
ncbi:MAG: universal stress protein [Blastocatellia bacterium]|nr:universal stress protein [Blastocatellia bacterium]